MGDYTEKSGVETNQSKKWLTAKIIVLLVILIPGLAYLWDFGFNAVTAADDDAKDFSLYTRSSEVATAFGDQMAPTADKEGESAWLDNLTFGNAGGLLGYSRELSEDEGGIGGWLTSQLSTSSATYSYKQLENIDASLAGYASYGATLNVLGLTEMLESGFNMGRFFIGWLMVAAYWMANLAPLLFGVILDLLAVFNPFRLFGWVINGASAINTPLIGEAVTMISGLYKAIQDFSLLITVPLLLGMTVVSIFMFKGNASKKITRLVLRVFMIFAGLPLIGATYTGVIEDLGNDLDTGSQFADYLVLSQFLDFENWSTHTRLAPPAGEYLMPTDPKGGSVLTGKAKRGLVFEINGTRTGVSEYTTAYSNMGSGFDADSFSDIVGAESTSTESNGSTSKGVLDLLERYRKSDVFTSSDFEGIVKSEIDGLIGEDGITSESVYDQFSMTASDLSEEEGDTLKHADLFKYKANWNIYNSGGLSSTPNMPFQISGGNTTTGKTRSIGSGAEKGALSPLAMYNFLNTSFGSTSMTVYSPMRASSSYVRESHASVTMANTGLNGFIQGLETFTIMTSLGVLGFAYAIGLLQVTMASLPRILSSVFGTAVGSMAFITKLLISTIVLILEIMATVLMYQLSESLLMGFLSGVEDFISTSLGEMSGFMTTMASLMNVVLTIVLVLFFIKNRTKLTKMVEETVTNAITKLMGGLDSTMNQGNAFHNPNDLRQAAAGATVVGDDGRVGSQGSGAYAAKGGEPGILDDMRGAMKDTLDQKNRSDRDPDAASMSKMDVAKGMAHRFGDRRAAGFKDGVSKAMGSPIAAVVGTALGIDDLDGHARERNEQDQKIEADRITATEFGIGDLGDQQDAKNGVKANASSASNTDANNADFKGIDAEGENGENGDTSIQAAMLNPNQVLSEDELESQLNEIDRESLDGVLGDIDLDDEAQAVLDQGGLVDPSQEEMGSIAEAADTTSVSDAYTSQDEEADKAMVNAVEQAGVSAESVDLDDPNSHPDVEPMSEEFDSYVDGLGEAVDKQSQSAEQHAMKAAALDKEAKELDEKARALEAEGTPDALSEAKELRETASSKRTDAEAEKKQGREAMRKAQKLGAKQQSAQSKRQEAIKGLTSNQSKPAQAASQFVKAEQQLAQLETKATGLREKLADLETNDPDNFQAIASTQDAIDTTEAKIPQAKQRLLQAEQQAVASLPDDGYQDLHSMSSQERAQYQKDHGFSDARMQEKVDETPTATEHRRGQRNAAMMLGRMASQVGATPAETKQKQREYINAKAASLYNKPKESAMQNLAQAQETLQDLQESGAPDKQIQQAERNLGRAVGKVKSIDRERSAFNKSLLKGSSVNQDHLGRQMQQIQRAKQTDKKQAARSNNVVSQPERFNTIAKKALTPSVSVPTSYDVPDLGATMNAKGSTLFKKKALAEHKIKSYADYKQRMHVVGQTIEGKEKEVKRLDQRVKAAERQRRMGDARKLIGQRTRAEQSLAQARSSAAEISKSLSDNAAGLFSERGYKPKAAHIVSGPIRSDMDQTTRAMQEYAKLQRQFEKLDEGITDDAPLAQRTRHKQLKGQVTRLRNQLTSVGIRKDQLSNSQRASQAAKLLTTEWLDTKNGKM